MGSESFSSVGMSEIRNASSNPFSVASILSFVSIGRSALVARQSSRSRANQQHGKAIDATGELS